MMTREQVVWSMMRKYGGPWTIGAVVDAIPGTTRCSIGHILQRLVIKGSATAEGRARSRVYRATDLKPDDMRGTAIGSLESLRKHSRANKWRAAP